MLLCVLLCCLFELFVCCYPSSQRMKVMLCAEVTFHELQRQTQRSHMTHQRLCTCKAGRTLHRTRHSRTRQFVFWFVLLCRTRSQSNTLRQDKTRRLPTTSEMSTGTCHEIRSAVGFLGFRSIAFVVRHHFLYLNRKREKRSKAISSGSFFRSM